MRIQHVCVRVYVWREDIGTNESARSALVRIHGGRVFGSWCLGREGDGRAHAWKGIQLSETLNQIDHAEFIFS